MFKVGDKVKYKGQTHRITSPSASASGWWNLRNIHTRMLSLAPEYQLRKV